MKGGIGTTSHRATSRRPCPPVLVVLQALDLRGQVLGQLPGHLVALGVPVVVAAGVLIPHLLPVAHLQLSHCRGDKDSPSLPCPWWQLCVSTPLETGTALTSCQGALGVVLPLGGWP